MFQAYLVKTQMHKIKTAISHKISQYRFWIFYLRVQNDYVTDKFPKVIPAWPVAGYAICEIPVVCSSYAKIANPSWPSSGFENYGRFRQILSRNYKGIFLSNIQI